MKRTRLDEVTADIGIDALLSDLEADISTLHAYIGQQKEPPHSTVLTRIWDAHNALSDVYAAVEALRLKHE